MSAHGGGGADVESRDGGRGRRPRPTPQSSGVGAAPLLFSPDMFHGKEVDQSVSTLRELSRQS